MRKVLASGIAGFFLAVFMVGSAVAAPVTIAVSEDASIASAVPAANFGGDSGLLSGSDGIDDPAFVQAPFRFLLKFDLTPLLTHMVTSARLVGYYLDDWDWFVNETHSIYEADNGWSEGTVTWGTQPTRGAKVAAFDAADPSLAAFRTNSGFLGGFVDWDITAAISAAALGGPAYSLMFAADNETLSGNFNLETFASREFDPGLAFRIEAVVPEPATILLLGMGLLWSGRRIPRGRLWAANPPRASDNGPSVDHRPRSS